jgi:hypothetical protein
MGGVGISNLLGMYQGQACVCVSRVSDFVLAVGLDTSSRNNSSYHSTSQSACMVPGHLVCETCGFCCLIESVSTALPANPPKHTI